MKRKHTFKTQNGVVYTPREVASSIVCYAKSLRKKPYKSILEPSAGDGSFLVALQQQEVDLESVTAVDKSKIAVRKLTSDFPQVNLVNDDFLNFASKQGHTKFDLIIGNPPYVRHSKMAVKVKKNLEKLAKNDQLYSGALVNLWAGFLKAAVDLASDDGIISFVLPYEMLNNSYGIKIQNWLSQDVGSVDIFISKCRAFSGIDQDAVIVVIDRCALGQGLRVHYVDNFMSLTESKSSSLKVDSNCVVSRHSFLLDSDTVGLLKRLSENLPTVDKFCTNSTGIVTGANKYFILSETEVDKNGLAEYAKPIIQKASDLPSSLTIDRSFECNNSQRYVLDFGGREVFDLTKEAREYIKKISKEGVASRYKCRNRDPWYQVPMLDAAPLYFFKRSHQKLKLIRNHTQLRVTDTAYRVYPVNEADADSFQISFYNSLTLLFSEMEGRFYGGGVLEVTPNEFRKLPVVYEKHSNCDQSCISELETFFLSSERIFQFGDAALKRKMQMTSHELETVQNAYLCLQDHRLRHGRTISNGAVSA